MKGFSRFLYALAAALAITGLTGCVERTLTVTTNPPGALVYLNDQEIGRTPVTRDFIWYGNYDLAIRKEGYETLKSVLQVKAPLFQIVPFDFFADVLPTHYKDEQHFSYNLSPQQPVDPQVLVQRAAELKAQLKSSQKTTQPSSESAATRP